MKKALLLLSLLLVVTMACDLSVNIAPTSEIPTAATTPIPLNEPSTPTPEIFIARTQAISAQIQLHGITLSVQEASLDVCDIPNCPAVPAGTRYLRVPLQALNLPADQFLDYKNLPEGIAIHDNTGTNTPFNRLTKYAPETQRLFLYFAVPQTATVFGLQWPGTAEIPLNVIVSTASATLPPSSTDMEVSVDSLNIVLPSGLASSVRDSQIPRADGQELPYWEKTPGHAEFKLEGYPLQGKSHEPKIYVYPALEYAAMVPGAFESMHRLRNVMNDPGASIRAEQLPAVPFFNEAQVFASNCKVVTFPNVEGVRFLTEYAQSATPVNNHDLFYQFQGFTNDGIYYIVAIFPITAPVLAETSDPGAILPAGGVSYPGINNSGANWQSYYADVTALLDATSPDAFFPTISKLDFIVQSIRIVP